MKFGSVGGVVKMALSITQTYAKTDIERTPSKLEISSRMAKLELSQKHAKVKIETELPKVLIDQQEAFSSAGLKNSMELSREAAQEGIKRAMEYIAKVAQDGDQMASIENSTSVIADIALNENLKTYDWNIDFIPKVGPKFEVTGSIKIEAERNWNGANIGVDATFVPGELDIKFTPAKLRIFLKEYPSVKIKYEDNKIDVKI